MGSKSKKKKPPAPVSQAVKNAPPQLSQSANGNTPENGSINWSNKLSRKNILSFNEEIYIPQDAPLLDTEISAAARAQNENLFTAKTGREPIAATNFTEEPFENEEPAALLDESFWDENIKPLSSNVEEGLREPTVLSTVKALTEFGAPPWDENEGAVKPDHLLRAQTISLDQEMLMDGTNAPISDGVDLVADMPDILDDDSSIILSDGFDAEIVTENNDDVNIIELEGADEDAVELLDSIKVLTSKAVDEDDGPEAQNAKATVDFDKLIKAQILRTAQTLKAMAASEESTTVPITAAAPKKKRNGQSSLAFTASARALNNNGAFNMDNNNKPQAEKPANSNADLGELSDFLNTKASNAAMPPAPSKNTEDNQELGDFLGTRASAAEPDDADNAALDTSISLDESIELDGDFDFDDDSFVDDHLDADPMLPPMSDIEPKLSGGRSVTNILPDNMPVGGLFGSHPVQDDINAPVDAVVQDLSEIEILGLDTIKPDDTAFVDEEPVDAAFLASPDDAKDLGPDPTEDRIDVATLDELMTDLDTSSASDIAEIHPEDLSDFSAIDDKINEDMVLEQIVNDMAAESGATDLGPDDMDTTEADLIILEQSSMVEKQDALELTDAVPDIEDDDDIIDIEQLEIAEVADDHVDLALTGIDSNAGNMQEDNLMDATEFLREDVEDLSDKLIPVEDINDDAVLAIQQPNITEYDKLTLSTYITPLNNNDKNAVLSKNASITELNSPEAFAEDDEDDFIGFNDDDDYDEVLTEEPDGDVTKGMQVIPLADYIDENEDEMLFLSVNADEDADDDAEADDFISLDDAVDTAEPGDADDTLELVMAADDDAEADDFISLDNAVDAAEPGDADDTLELVMASDDDAEADDFISLDDAMDTAEPGDTDDTLELVMAADDDAEADDFISLDDAVDTAEPGDADAFDLDAFLSTSTKGQPVNEPKPVLSVSDFYIDEPVSAIGTTSATDNAEADEFISLDDAVDATEPDDAEETLELVMAADDDAEADDFISLDDAVDTAEPVDTEDTLELVMAADDDAEADDADDTLELVMATDDDAEADEFISLDDAGDTAETDDAEETLELVMASDDDAEADEFISLDDAVDTAEPDDTEETLELVMASDDDAEADDFISLDDAVDTAEPDDTEETLELVMAAGDDAEPDDFISLDDAVDTTEPVDTEDTLELVMAADDDAEADEFISLDDAGDTAEPGDTEKTLELVMATDDDAEADDFISLDDAVDTTEPVDTEETLELVMAADDDAEADDFISLDDAVDTTEPVDTEETLGLVMATDDDAEADEFISLDDAEDTAEHDDAEETLELVMAADDDAKADDFISLNDAVATTEPVDAEETLELQAEDAETEFSGLSMANDNLNQTMEQPYEGLDKRDKHSTPAAKTNEATINFDLAAFDALTIQSTDDQADELLLTEDAGDEAQDDDLISLTEADDETGATDELDLTAFLATSTKDAPEAADNMDEAEALLTDDQPEELLLTEDAADEAQDDSLISLTEADDETGATDELDLTAFLATSTKDAPEAADSMDEAEALLVNDQPDELLLTEDAADEAQDDDLISLTEADDETGATDELDLTAFLATSTKDAPEAADNMDEAEALLADDQADELLLTEDAGDEAQDDDLISLTEADDETGATDELDLAAFLATSTKDAPEAEDAGDDDLISLTEADDDAADADITLLDTEDAIEATTSVNAEWASTLDGMAFNNDANLLDNENSPLATPELYANDDLAEIDDCETLVQEFSNNTFGLNIADFMQTLEKSQTEQPANALAATPDEAMFNDEWPLQEDDVLSYDYQEKADADEDTLTLADFTEEETPDISLDDEMAEQPFALDDSAQEDDAEPDEAALELADFTPEEALDISLDDEMAEQPLALDDSAQEDDAEPDEAALELADFTPEETLDISLDDEIMEQPLALDDSAQEDDAEPDEAALELADFTPEEPADISLDDEVDLRQAETDDPEWLLENFDTEALAETYAEAEDELLFNEALETDDFANEQPEDDQVFAEGFIAEDDEPKPQALVKDYFRALAGMEETGAEPDESTEPETQTDMEVAAEPDNLPDFTDNGISFNETEEAVMDDDAPLEEFLLAENDDDFFLSLENENITATTKKAVGDEDILDQIDFGTTENTDSLLDLAASRSSLNDEDSQQAEPETMDTTAADTTPVNAKLSEFSLLEGIQEPDLLSIFKSDNAVKHEKPEVASIGETHEPDAFDIIDEDDSLLDLGGRQTVANDADTANIANDEPETRAVATDANYKDEDEWLLKEEADADLLLALENPAATKDIAAEPATAAKDLNPTENSENRPDLTNGQPVDNAEPAADANAETVDTSKPISPKEYFSAMLNAEPDTANDLPALADIEERSLLELDIETTQPQLDAAAAPIEQTAAPEAAIEPITPDGDIRPETMQDNHMADPENTAILAENAKVALHEPEETQPETDAAPPPVETHAQTPITATLPATDPNPVQAAPISENNTQKDSINMQATPTFAASQPVVNENHEPQTQPASATQAKPEVTSQTIAKSLQPAISSTGLSSFCGNFVITGGFAVEAPKMETPLAGPAFAEMPVSAAPDEPAPAQTETETPAPDILDELMAATVNPQTTPKVGKHTETPPQAVAPLQQAAVKEPDFDAEFAIASDPMRELTNAMPYMESPYEFSDADPFLQYGYEEYVMEHDPLMELELTVAQFATQDIAFDPAKLEAEAEQMNLNKVNLLSGPPAAFANNAPETSPEPPAFMQPPVTMEPEPAPQKAESDKLETILTSTFKPLQNAAPGPFTVDEPRLEMYEHSYDTGYRIEDLGTDPIDFYRHEKTLQAEEDYNESRNASPSAYGAPDYFMAEQELQNAYENFLKSPVKPNIISMLDSIKDGFSDQAEAQPAASQPAPAQKEISLESLKIVKPETKAAVEPGLEPATPAATPAAGLNEMQTTTATPEAVMINTAETTAGPLTEQPFVAYNDTTVAADAAEVPHAPDFFSNAALAVTPVPEPLENFVAETADTAVSHETENASATAINETGATAESGTPTVDLDTEIIAADDDDAPISLAEIAAAQVERAQVQIAEPNVNLHQLVEDITAQSATDATAELLAEPLAYDGKNGQDVRPMINIISNTQVLENVMARMLDRVMGERMMPLLENMIRNAVKEVLADELKKIAKPADE